MAFGAIFDEAGFKGLFDASDAAFVDVGLFLFAGRDFDIKIVKRLAIHDGHTQLFTLSALISILFIVIPRLGRASRAAVAPGVAAFRGSRRCGKAANKR
jgi:hypothetical protein